VRTADRDTGTAAADERLVRRLVDDAKAGDRDAMRRLYLRFAPQVRAHVERIVANRDDADDVTQQIFAKLLTELWRYEPGAAPFGAWVSRVSRNAAIDHVRRSRALRWDAVPDGLQEAGDAQVESRASLREALASLTAGQRDVLVLRHVVGLEPEEIAACLGRTLRSVHCLHHRGRAAACSALGERGLAPATVRRRASLIVTGGTA
jgi:RNA polymerase sigma-70 factor (ECF subfamily)